MCGGHPENLTPAVLSDRAAGALWGKSASLTRRVALPAGTALSATPLPVAVGTPSSTTCTAGAQSACSSRPRPGAFPDAARSASSFAVNASSIRCISLCSVICCCSRRSCAPWSSSMSVAAMAIVRRASSGRLSCEAQPTHAHGSCVCVWQRVNVRVHTRQACAASLPLALSQFSACVCRGTAHAARPSHALTWMDACASRLARISTEPIFNGQKSTTLECKCRKAAKPSAPKLVNFAWAGSVDSHPHVWFFCAIQRLSPRARANGVGQDRDRSVHGEVVA